MMGDSKDYRYALRGPQSGNSDPSQQSTEAHCADLHGRAGDTVLHPSLPCCPGCSIQAKSRFCLLSRFELVYVRKRMLYMYLEAFWHQVHFYLLKKNKNPQLQIQKCRLKTHTNLAGCLVHTRVFLRSVNWMESCVVSLKIAAETDT